MRSEIYPSIKYHAGIKNFTVVLLFCLFSQNSPASDKPVSIPLAAGYTKTNVSICGGGSDGSITVIPSGGTSPYSYSWTATNGYSLTTTNPVITGLTFAYYTVTITDADLNTFVISNIHISRAFAVYVTNSGSASSACANTGTIILYGNAGVLPYSFSLDGTNYQTGNTFYNLAAGTYTGYIKDAKGCVSSKPSIVIGTAPGITGSAYVRAAGYCSDDGQIQLFKSGGIPPFTYSINDYNYQVSNTFSGLPGGTSVTGYVKDAAGCKAMVPGLTITKANELFVSSTKKNTSTCVNDGSITFDQTGGYGPFTYSLDNINFQSSNTFTGLGANHYYGYVKDSRGCKVQKITTINLNPIIVTSVVGDVTNCAVYDGTIQLNHTGGTGAFTYSLDGNDYQTVNSFNDLAPGTYTGYVKDSMICIAVLSDIIVNNTCISFQQSNSPKYAEKKADRITVKEGLLVQAWPNVTSSEFSVLLQSSSAKKVSVVVTNVMGGKVYQTEVKGKQQLKFGNNFASGIYLLQVTQGTEKQTIRLIKE